MHFHSEVQEEVIYVQNVWHKKMFMFLKTGAKWRQENAKNSIKIANLLYPNEEWIKVEKEIYLSKNRPIGKKTRYKDELIDAQILRDMGCTIYLTPEKRNVPGKKFDALVNGLKFEFKNISGNSNTLEIQFLRSRSQAPNVFINLEKSNLSIKHIISTLYGARNKNDSETSHGYSYHNKFEGGYIVLKIKNRSRLVFLNVNGLKSKKTGR